MATKVLLLIFFFLVKGYAGEPHVFELKTKGKSPQSLRLAYVQGMAVGEACLKELKKCDKRLRQSLVGNKAAFSTAGLISPASEFCLSRGGLSVTLVDTVGNEYAYCELSGRYLVDAWDLLDWAKMGEPSLPGTL